MVSNNPITFKDQWGLEWRQLPDLRIQALDTFFASEPRHIYPSPLDYFNHRYTLTSMHRNSTHGRYGACRGAAGYSYDEMGSYNESVSIGAPYPAKS